MEKIEIMALEPFRAAFGPWLEQVRPLLEARDWGPAFKSYPFVRNSRVPWSPLEKDLSRCRVALLTTAGLYLKGEQEPFDAAVIEGDWSHREFPAETPAEALGIAHDHYDHARALEDINSVLPLDRFRELEAEGVIGELAGTVFSITGYCPRADMIAEETTPKIVAGLKALEADVLFHIPV